MIRLENRSIAKIGAGWGLVALFAGETELLSFLPPGGVQLVLIGLTAGLLLAYRLFGDIKRWADGIPYQAILLCHSVRFVGFYFLYLHAEGELPYAFAVPGGIGDIAAASLAVLISCIPKLRGSRGMLLGWNALGMADILFVVATAGGLAWSNPESMRALVQLPLSFLPTLIVPLIIASHILIFARLYREGAAKSGKTGLTAFFARNGGKLIDL